MKESFTITEEQKGKRIDVLASELFPQYSRSIWSKYGTFILDEKEKKSGTKVQEGQSWQVRCDYEEIKFDHLEPWDYPLKVLAESDSWVVIEKPKGISMHPSVSERTNETIVNALVHQFKKLSESYDEIDGIQVPRPGLVHRLDKETSGIVLVAKNNKVHEYFQAHWGEVTKIYTAIVKGGTPPKGKIEAPIMRDPRNRQRMMVGHRPNAKDALTYFEKLDEDENHSLLSVKIMTGRTHQIRVHLSSIGFPVVGDKIYNDDDARRMMLHATELTFPDPDNGGAMKTVISHVPFQL